MIKGQFSFLLFVATALTGGCSGTTDTGQTAITSSNSTATIVSSNSGQSSISTSGTPAAPANLPGAGRPILRFEPAPENSQIAQATDSSGQLYEVRIWKKHPQLLKIESVGVDQKSKALTIILRTGKVFNITTDIIPNVKLATANQFIDLAGVQPSSQPAAADTGTKKAK